MGRLGRFGAVDAVWEEMVRTGEWWRRVWFLEPAEVERLRPWGFELSDLQAVVGAFKQVYPSTVARRLLDNDWKPDERTPLEVIWRKEDEHRLVVSLFARV